MSVQRVERSATASTWLLDCGHEMGGSLYVGQEVECASCALLERLALSRRRRMEEAGIVFYREQDEDYLFGAR